MDSSTDAINVPVVNNSYKVWQRRNDWWQKPGQLSAITPFTANMRSSWKSRTAQKNCVIRLYNAQNPAVLSMELYLFPSFVCKNKKREIPLVIPSAVTAVPFNTWKASWFHSKHVNILHNSVAERGDIGQLTSPMVDSRPNLNIQLECYLSYADGYH